MIHSTTQRPVFTICSNKRSSSFYIDGAYVKTVTCLNLDLSNVITVKLFEGNRWTLMYCGSFGTVMIKKAHSICGVIDGNNVIVDGSGWTWPTDGVIAKNDKAASSLLVKECVEIEKSLKNYTDVVEWEKLTKFKTMHGSANIIECETTFSKQQLSCCVDVDTLIMLAKSFELFENPDKAKECAERLGQEYFLVEFSLLSKDGFDPNDVMKNHNTYYVPVTQSGFAELKDVVTACKQRQFSNKLGEVAKA